MPFATAANQFAALAGYTPSRSTFARWCRTGVKLPSGKVVRLGARRVGARWLVAEGAIEAFLRELAAG